MKKKIVIKNKYEMITAAKVKVLNRKLNYFDYYFYRKGTDHECHV